ncbi:NAD(P)H-hydrate dehydratase [Roseovarius nanhaiticus]|uniref:NAD(P)H-hydrate dehydratase n=1 Tax=Roseovarius nanhaiticus TaxID=573024 RepID=UPI0031F08C4C
MDRQPRLVTMGPARIASLRKPGGAHKYDHGHAVILSGGAGATGAARLAARAALRIGAGLVTLGVPPAAQLEVAAHETAVMLMRIQDAQTLNARLEDARISALCLGPGLGVDRAGPLLARALVDARCPLVIDADALTAIGKDGALMAALHSGCLLTPHMGEFARMFPDIEVPDAVTPRAAALRRAAERAGCTILLKGAETLIAGPDGTCYRHSATGDRAAPWLATAGAGDVLAGIITGLIARGHAPIDAAATGAWLHAEAARLFGPGLVAEDLPEMLPRVLSRLGV